ncbi:SH2 domain-containing protein 1B [Tenrec ecaudatus]|uniref:SH2 domain-containing protein 1B n=1 Tax=Tenrec ecaudatus TaxID=94439 RepID=UPI003F594775
MDLPYYHGSLTKRDCEILLLREQVDGTFLLRDSESVPGALCLCVSFKNLVYTYRIFPEKHGHYTIQSVENHQKQTFSSLQELISKYEKPNQGLVVHLSRPIKRMSRGQRWRRSQMKFNDIYENCSSEYVEVLP